MPLTDVTCEQERRARSGERQLAPASASQRQPAPAIISHPLILGLRSSTKTGLFQPSKKKKMVKMPQTSGICVAALKLEALHEHKALTEWCVRIKLCVRVGCGIAVMFSFHFLAFLSSSDPQASPPPPHPLQARTELVFNCSKKNLGVEETQSRVR